VLFADLKGSMKLLADRDPEDARKILDPVLEHMMEARARKPPRPKQKADPPKTSARLPQELARDAIAHEEPMPDDKVKMTFRAVLARQDAEALAARAIREEKNIATVVTEILEAAAR
jgi:hypothetical protein